VKHGDSMRHAAKWARWRYEGMTYESIAQRSGCSPTLVSRRVRDYLAALTTPVAEEIPSEEVLRSIRLEMGFGSSCKPLKDLECHDIHPCPRCLGWGNVSVETVSTIELESLSARGEKILDLGDLTGLVVACPRCLGSRVGQIQKGSPITCYACGASGKDHLPDLSTRPTVAGEGQGPTSFTAEDLKGGHE
jgi:hypothetical protein